MYASLKGKNNEEEAICLANIFKIKYMYIGDNNIKNLLELGKRCEFIVKNKNLDQIVNGIKILRVFIIIWKEIMKLWF